MSYKIEGIINYKTFVQKRFGVKHVMPVIGKKTEKALTLIELLVVVAVIAILAAIAIPHLLEAQTRSKVSRAKADLRTVANAIQIYQLDWNNLPISNNDPNQLNRLTTPIAYISSNPRDVFFPGEQSDLYYQLHGRYYRFWILSVVKAGYPSWGGDTLAEYYAKGYRWLLLSRGPDGKEIVIETEIVDYDPTNGTISQGDINYWGK